MNSFDQPPTSSPVPLEPPPSRGARARTALVALIAGSLVGGGAVAIGELASADRPTVQTVQTAATPTGSPLAEVGGDGEGDEPPPVESGARPSIDGQIVIDTGDGDPIVIDLGEGTVDGAPFDRVLRCLPADLAPIDPERLDELFEGLPIDPEAVDLDRWLEGLPLDELPRVLPPGGLPPFDLDGTHITIVGPDGVTIVELGEGDGSVTISRQDGELTVATDGDASLTELPGPGELDGTAPEGWEPGDLPSWFDDLEQCLADATDEPTGSP